MTPEERATLVTDYLFTDSRGNEAERLVFVDSQGTELGGWGYAPIHNQITKAITAAIEEEREECAKLIEGEIDLSGMQKANLVTIIRARSEK